MYYQRQPYEVEKRLPKGTTLRITRRSHNFDITDPFEALGSTLIIDHDFNSLIINGIFKEILEGLDFD